MENGVKALHRSYYPVLSYLEPLRLQDPTELPFLEVRLSLERYLEHGENLVMENTGILPRPPALGFYWFF